MSIRRPMLRVISIVVLASAFEAIRAEGQATPPAPPSGDTATSHSDKARARSIDTVRVIGRIDDLIGVAASASEGRVGSADLRPRPITREGELLESVPGVIVTQHSGEGKANQYFVRGFNLDHGTDFQTKIDGMPLNMPTHGHGQGYTDLNFLIPEFVDYLDYKLGVYHADLGDFGSAGGAEFHLVRRLDRSFASVGGGENGLARIAAGTSTKVRNGDLLFGGEVKSYNGPWTRAEDIRKLSGLARYSWEQGASRFSILGMGYRNRWNSNDQIPLRAVRAGLISQFDQIDSTDGGNAQRYSLSGSWRHAGSSSVQNVELFGIYSDLGLYSDFTYFLDNPVRGDQFNQPDRRIILGGSATNALQSTALGTLHTLKFGLQTRADIINGLGLYRTERRVRYETVRQDRVRETGTGLFMEAESRWRPWFRSTFGARADGYTFNVTSDRAANSGIRRAGIISPKASLIFSPSAETEFYLSGGFGFHSNDARGTTITVDPASGERVDKVDPLVRSRGAEIGLRASPIRGLRSTLSVWALGLNSELLFTGDAGATEPSAASDRRGVTLANFYRPVPELSIDADVSFAHAQFSGVASDQTHIPGALENVIAGGIAWTPSAQGAFAALRVRHFGAYPLIEDNSVRARAATLVNADLGYTVRSGARFQVSMLNVLNSRAEDIQYYYASRLQGDPPDGVNGVHFHPVEPRQIRASFELKF
jgi:hypothetical protein